MATIEQQQGKREHGHPEPHQDWTEGVVGKVGLAGHHIDHGNDEQTRERDHQ